MCVCVCVLYLAVENAVRTCRADCLTCTALIRENQLVSNTTGGKYFAIDIKPDEVQNYIYPLTCTHRGIQYVRESITPFESKNEISQKM